MRLPNDTTLEPRRPRAVGLWRDGCRDAGGSRRSANGAASRLTVLTSAERAGLRETVELRLADDPRVYVYRQTRYMSSLFLVDGAR